MSRYILTGDMPNNCHSCIFEERMKKEINGFTFKCVALRGNLLKDHKDYNTKRHPKCPLQDTTELCNILDSLKNTMEYENVTRKYWVEHINKIYKALGDTND